MRLRQIGKPSKRLQRKATLFGLLDRFVPGRKAKREAHEQRMKLHDELLDKMYKRCDELVDAGQDDDRHSCDIHDCAASLVNLYKDRPEKNDEVSRWLLKAHAVLQRGERKEIKKFAHRFHNSIDWSDRKSSWFSADAT